MEVQPITCPMVGWAFERLIGVMKSVLTKVIGNAMLTFQEIEKTLHNIECFTSNRPHRYVREDFDKPMIAQNVLMRGERAALEENIVKEVATRRLEFLRRCKEQLGKRWENKYLRALDKRKQLLAMLDDNKVENGRVVLIKDAVKTK